MDVTELVSVFCDSVTQRAFVELHMVYIVQHREARRGDQARHLRRHLRMRQIVADMVGSDVERLEVHVNAAFLGDLGAFEQHIVHRAQLYRVGQIGVMVDHNAAVTECIRVNGNALGADLACRCD